MAWSPLGKYYRDPDTRVERIRACMAPLCDKYDASEMQLLLAWLMWVMVGSALVGFGTWWLWESAPNAAPWVAAGSLFAGAVKSRLVLDSAARRVVGRIRARGDGRCVGGFLSLRTWGLVVLMMAAGRLLRGTVAHPSSRRPPPRRPSSVATRPGS